MVIRLYHRDASFTDLNTLGVIDLKQFEQKRSLMGDDVVNLEFATNVVIPFAIGDYIMVFGNRYTLNRLPQMTKLSRNNFNYECEFESLQYQLGRVNFMNVTFSAGVSEAAPNFFVGEFSLTGNAGLFVETVVYNMHRLAEYEDIDWNIGTTYTTDVRTLDFSGENCLSALHKVCEEFDIEFTITQVGTNAYINLFAKGGAGSLTGLTFEYGRHEALYEIKRLNVDSSNIITALLCLGSSKNLPANYRGFSPRLKLPSNEMSIITDAEKIELYGFSEGLKIFEQIYPHFDGSVTSMGTIGTTYTEFYDAAMPFDLNATSGGSTLYIIAGTTPKIHFNTGNLAGYEFDLSSYDHATKKFRILSFTDERGQRFPDPATGAFQPAAGDDYVILDIRPPQSYIDAAESALETAGQAEYLKVSQPQVKYEVRPQHAYIADNFEGYATLNCFSPGDNVTILDTQVGVNKLMRIVSFTRQIIQPSVYTIDLDDYVRKTRRFINKNQAVKIYNGVQLFNLTDPSWRRRVQQAVIIQERIVTQGEVNIRYGIDIELNPGSNTIEFLSPADWGTDSYFLLAVPYNSSGNQLYFSSTPVKTTTGFTCVVPAEFTDVFMSYFAVKGNPTTEAP